MGKNNGKAEFKTLASMEEDEIDNEMAEYAKQLREQKEQENKGSTTESKDELEGPVQS